MSDLIYVNEKPVHKKSLKIEVKKDGLSLATDSTDNDLMMMGMFTVLLIAVVGMVVMYKIKTKDK